MNYESDEYFVKLLRIDENETLFHEGSLFLSVSLLYNWNFKYLL